MKALVIYDSVFGNTEKVAQAIGAALGSPEEVEVIRIADARPEQLVGLDVLVVGSPTRAFRPMPSVSGFIKRMPSDALQGVRTVAFDTRISLEDAKPAFLRTMMRLFGWAANPIARGLARKGGVQAVAPEGFDVLGSEGPLREGELERAAEWARRIVAAD
jgi:flavodoxin I